MRYPLMPPVPRVLRFIEAWPWVHRVEDPERRRDVLRRFALFDEVDESIIVEGCRRDSLYLMWAGAVLWHGTPAEIEARRWPALANVATGDVAAYASVLGSVERRMALARRAEQYIARSRKWKFRETDRQVVARNTPGTGNRPRELVNEMIVAAYRENRPNPSEPDNPQELRDQIGDALGLFFPPALLSDKRIRDAIGNDLRTRRA